MSLSYERSRTYGERRGSKPTTDAFSRKEGSTLIDKQYKRLIERTEKVTYDLTRLQSKSSHLTGGLVIAGSDSPRVRLKEYESTATSRKKRDTNVNKIYDTLARTLAEESGGSPKSTNKDSSGISGKDRLSPDKITVKDNLSDDETPSKDHLTPDKTTGRGRLNHRRTSSRDSSNPVQIPVNGETSRDRASSMDLLSPDKALGKNYRTRNRSSSMDRASPDRARGKDYLSRDRASSFDRVSPDRATHRDHFTRDRSFYKDRLSPDRSAVKDYLNGDRTYSKNRLSPDRSSSRDRRSPDRISNIDVLSSARYRKLDLSAKSSPILRHRREREDSKPNVYGQITTEQEWKRLLDDRTLIERAVELVQEGLRYPKHYVYESDTPSPKPYHIPIGTKLIPNPFEDDKEDKEDKVWKRIDRPAASTTTKTTEAETETAVNTTSTTRRARLLGSTNRPARSDKFDIEPRQHIRGRIKARLENIRNNNNNTTIHESSNNNNNNEESNNTDNDNISNDGDSSTRNSGSFETLDTSGYESTESFEASEIEKRTTREEDLQTHTDKEEDNRGTLASNEPRDTQNDNEGQGGLIVDARTDVKNEEADEILAASITEESEDEAFHHLLQRSKKLLEEKESNNEHLIPPSHQEISVKEEDGNADEKRFNDVITVIIEKSDDLMNQEVLKMDDIVIGDESNGEEESATKNRRRIDDESVGQYFSERINVLVQRSDEIFEQQEEVILLHAEGDENVDPINGEGREVMGSIEPSESSILHGAQEILNDTETLLLESGITKVEDELEVSRSKITDSSVAESREVKSSILGRLLAVLRRLLAFLTFQTCRTRPQSKK